VLGIDDKWAATVYLAFLVASVLCVLGGLWAWWRNGNGQGSPGGQGSPDPRPRGHGPDHGQDP